MLSLVAVALFVALIWLGRAGMLWLGARLARIPGVGFGRALVAMTALAGVNAIVAVWPLLASVPPLIQFALGLLAEVAGAWLIVWAVFRTTFGRAVLAWLPEFGWALAWTAVLFVVVKPLVCAPYIAPNVAMAPTLVGPHRLGTCPHCGGPLILGYDPHRDRDPGAEQLGICARCMRSGTGRPNDPAGRPADRFLVNRLLALRRWDVVAVRPPDHPEFEYVKRLVGLPGEEVVLRDGKIWIDGVRQESPADIAQLQFTASLEGGDPDAPLWGSPRRPARLGSDEYFVVGDFTEHSADSRRWGRGLPRSAITGVVAFVYWPPGRWRVFR